MNLFDKAIEIQTEIQSKSRKGSSVRRDSIKLPFFKGNMRSKKHAYSIDCKSIKVKGKKQKKVIVPVSKPVTGAFLISYFSCLAYDIVHCENKYRIANNFFSNHFDSEKKDLVSFTTFLIEVLLSQEGFAFSDYSQGTIQGAKRIEKHLRDISERENLKLVIDSNSLISGFNTDITNQVLLSV